MAIVEAVAPDATFYSPTESAAIQKLNGQMNTLRAYFKERDEIIEAMFVALLAKQHLVMVGSPGTAKSYLIESFCGGFSDFERFDWQLTKFTTPEELFGPYSLKALKDGRYERIPQYKLQQADIAYLDEIFNANSSILNALNSAMNERLFERTAVPLNSIFSGTNQIPEDPVLQAFFDRFLFRFIVNEISDASAFEDMLMLGPYQLDPALVLTKAEIAELQAKARGVKYDVSVRMITKLRESLKEENIYPSSRRFRWAISALQALALLNGRKEVAEEDILILKNILWADKKEIAIVEQLIVKVINPALAQIKELLAQANEIEKNVRDADPKNAKDLGLIMESLEKMRLIATQIEDIKGKRRMPPKVTDVANRVIEQISDAGKRIQKEKLPFAF